MVRLSVRIARLFRKLRDFTTNVIDSSQSKIKTGVATERSNSEDAAVPGQQVARDDQINSDRYALQSPTEALEQQLSRIVQTRGDGRLMEFDYSYHPRVRDWKNLPGGNRYVALIARDDDRYHQRISSVARFRNDFAKIAISKPTDDAEPHWGND